MESYDGTVEGYGEDEEVLVFHHKKGEFREREAKIYSDLATGQNQPKRGLFRVLVSTKGNRIIFFTMLLCFALVFVVSLLSRSPEEGVVRGVSCTLSAFSFGDDVYVSVSLADATGKRGKKLAAPGEPRALHAQLEAYSDDGLMADAAAADYLYTTGQDDAQFIRATFPDFSIVSVRCTVTCGEESTALSCTVQAR